MGSLQLEAKKEENTEQVMKAECRHCFVKFQGYLSKYEKKYSHQK